MSQNKTPRLITLLGPITFTPRSFESFEILPGHHYFLLLHKSEGLLGALSLADAQDERALRLLFTTYAPDLSLLELPVAHRTFIRFRDLLERST